MKTPSEIKEFAEKRYTKFLQSILKEEIFFPLNIPVGDQNTTRSIQEIDKDISLLQKNEKSIKGFGYKLIISKRNYNRHGLNTYIDEILIENENDYLKFIKKEKQTTSFRQNYNIIKNHLPQLETWALQNPLKIIENEGKWVELIKVCQYFIQNPKPNLYIRELPIDNLYTKFIEENRTIVNSLLNHILPSDSINIETNDFEKRFGLKEKETIIRFRILDESLFIHQLSDISLPISQFDKFTLKDTIQKVFIVENEMCFLTFPNVKNSIIIFGKGKAVANLSKVSWLYLKPIYYWGDIDTEGFEILSILREFKSDAIAQMMSWDCFQKFSSQGLSEGKNSVKNIPKNLSEAEIELFNHLNSLPKNRCRLEQEKIPQWYVESQVKQL